MLIEKIEIAGLERPDYLSTLQSLNVGESLYFSELKQAQSLRSLSYYLIRTRRLSWRFTFRKMDRGWRLIRVK